jgi:cold shock protein
VGLDETSVCRLRIAGVPAFRPCQGGALSTAYPCRVLTGTVRWWKDEKGYGRITGDDGLIYFCHFSAILGVDGYRALQQGQRVEFAWLGGVADHGRRAADNVRLIPVD